MKEERRIVLKLLEENKINKDEALKLLDAIDKAKVSERKKVNIVKGFNKAKDTFNDVSLKATKKYEELKPELQKATEKTKSTISEVYKDVSDTIKTKSKEKSEVYEDNVDIVDIDENVDTDSVIELGTKAEYIKRLPTQDELKETE